jgi:hypothetical protein
MPHKPKPPSIRMAPSGMSLIASSAFETTLFIAIVFGRKISEEKISKE